MGDPLPQQCKIPCKMGKMGENTDKNQGGATFQYWSQTESRSKAQIPLGSSRHVTSRHVRRVEPMHFGCRACRTARLDKTSSTGSTCRIVSRRAKWNLGLNVQRWFQKVNHQSIINHIPAIGQHFNSFCSVNFAMIYIDFVFVFIAFISHNFVWHLYCC